MEGSTARQVWQTPSRFVWIAASQAFGELSQKAPMGPITAAAQMATSTSPKRARMRSTAPRSCA